MGIHPFPTVEAQADTLAGARREMWLWAEPLILDLVAEWYARALPNGLAASLMLRKHCRLWHAVFHDQPAAVPLIMEDLQRTGTAFGLGSNALDDINNVVLEELIDVVLCRFRASRTTTKTLSLVLMSAMSCLRTTRAAA